MGGLFIIFLTKTPTKNYYWNRRTFLTSYKELLRLPIDINILFLLCFAITLVHFRNKFALQNSRRFYIIITLAIAHYLFFATLATNIYGKTLCLVRFEIESADFSKHYY